MNRRDLARVLGTGVVGAAALTVAGQQAQAQAPAAAAGKSRLHQILERGTMRVGTTGDFNPMSFRDTSTNSYQGFDVEAMTQLATDSGVKVEWVQTEWAQIVAGIGANRFDIFSGASVTMPRARGAAFTLPYFEFSSVPVAAKSAAGRFGSWDAINADGVRVAVSMGTVFEDQAKAHFPKARLVSVQAPATGFQEVLAGRADLTLTSNVEASSLVRRFDALTLLAASVQPRNRRPAAFMMAQDDPIWLNYVNTWVTLKAREGYFEALENKWLPKS
ncbi:MAG: transporter substrate-binding domain-containing protein [Proteobacteria bacterium]|nr:transporter substrate-binding domain-containing protein [Pseudomonadota bacterium]